MAWFKHDEVCVHFEESGGGDPLLLLPGFSGTIASYQPLRARLAERYRVIAADLPGSGRSLPLPRNYGTDYYQKDAATFIALLQSLGCGPSHLLGHSDGGEVALVMAEQSPGHARSVIAWGAAGALSDPDQSISTTFRNAVDAPVPSMAGYRAYLIDTYGDANARAMVRSFADAFDAILAAGGDISRTKAHLIGCPVLLLAGRDDKLCPSTLVLELAALVDRVKVIVVEKAGHVLHEEQPDWFFATIADWLAQN